MLIAMYLFCGLSIITILGILIILIMYKKDSKKEYCLQTIDEGTVTGITIGGVLLVILFLIFAWAIWEDHRAEINAIDLINSHYNTHFTVEDWYYNKEIVEQILESKKNISEEK
jgi:CTP:phosphocholine cytidylyltransferase-like protein